MAGHLILSLDLSAKGLHFQYSLSFMTMAAMIVDIGQESRNLMVNMNRFGPGKK